MSQITAVSSLPLGRRIAEIMDEKGAAFSQRAFAPRVGFSKDTLGRVIAGERNIKPSELIRIAKGLSISVARLKQEDIKKASEESVERLETKKDLSRALQLAEQVYAVALGASEKCDSAVLLARTMYALGDVENAHDLLLNAYRDAELASAKYNDADRLYKILSKLMITFTVKKEFSHLSEILGRVESVFKEEPEKQGAIYFSKATIARQFGNHAKFGESLYQSLECYRQVGKMNDIGRAELNVAHFEFGQRNYERAKEYLQEAIQHLHGDQHYQLVAIKDYSKVLGLARASRRRNCWNNTWL